jgi:prepilin-type N-terminal cleavage/methylation domain-containing protein
MTKFRAFSLVELLVVMGIIAMVSGLGIYGLIRFQANTRLQTKLGDINSVLSTIQNNSRNSTAFENNGNVDDRLCLNHINKCVADYIAINFSSSDYEVFACQRSGEIISCPNNNKLESFRSVVVPDISISYRGNSCEYIAFERLTVDIIDVTGNPVWQESEHESCEIVISNEFGDQRIIVIDLQTNSIVYD